MTVSGTFLFFLGLADWELVVTVKLDGNRPIVGNVNLHHGAKLSGGHFVSGVIALDIADHVVVHGFAYSAWSCHVEVRFVRLHLGIQCELGNQQHFQRMVLNGLLPHATAFIFKEPNLEYFVSNVLQVVHSILFMPSPSVLCVALKPSTMYVMCDAY
eukprot:m.37817 g.37817  ORF g.37817 m.37817 type:complete len:157 (+) comp12547_c0_seq2:1285-1755(+)